MKNKLLGIAIGVFLLAAISSSANAWGTPFWKFETGTGVVLQIDDSGNLNTSGQVNATTLHSKVAQGTSPLTVISTTVVDNLNVSTAVTAYDLTCTDCIGGTEIAELADADISNTLTCSDLVSGSSVVSDTEVDNDLTISGGSISSSSFDWFGMDFSNTMHYGNITACSDTQILKMSGASWTCASDDTGAAVTDVWVNETGDIMSGILNITGNVTMADAAAFIDTNQSNSWILFGTDGSITFHAEA